MTYDQFLAKLESQEQTVVLCRTPQEELELLQLVWKNGYRWISGSTSFKVNHGVDILLYLDSVSSLIYWSEIGDSCVDIEWKDVTKLEKFIYVED